MNGRVPDPWPERHAADGLARVGAHVGLLVPEPYARKEAGISKT